MRSIQLKFIFRHLWRRRFFTTLNIAGLAIAISVCWIIFRIASHEMSYDASHPHKEQIVKVISHIQTQQREQRMAGVAAPLYQGIRAEVPGVDRVVPVFKQWVTQVRPGRISGDKPAFDMPEGIVSTQAVYFEMNPYHWIAGDKTTALSRPDQVVLTQSRAKTYFPDKRPEEIIGSGIFYYGSDTIRRTVTGIVADYPEPSEFTAKEFISMEDALHPLVSWTNTNGSDQLFLQLKPSADPEAVLAKINALSEKMMQAAFKDSPRVISYSKSYEFIPLGELHFAGDVSDFGVQKTNKQLLYGLMGVGLFVLLLACINYINLSIAQIPRRSKEIGIRKTLGSKKWHLIAGFLLETVFTLFPAFLLAMILSTQVFGILKDMIPQGVTLGTSFPVFAGFMLLMILVITLLSGLYPGWVLSRVLSIEALKSGQVTFSGRRFSLQKLLIVFQFVIAQVFIIATLVVSAQMRYLIHSDMGFEKEAVVLFSAPWKYQNDPAYAQKPQLLQQLLEEQPGVEAVSLGTPPLSSGYASSPFGLPGDQAGEKPLIMYKKVIDSLYLNVYRMDLLAGRNLRTSDNVREYLINETAARQLGFTSPEQAVGQQLAPLKSEPSTIVGVVKDFHTQDFYTGIQPLVLMHDAGGLHHFNLKLRAGDPAGWQQTLERVASLWKQVYPEADFNHRFYDQSLEAMYKQEQQVSLLIKLTAVMSIVISCLGLFGLSTLLTQQRTREIGIRKVLGATVRGTVTLLTSDFIRIVLIALLIATPLAWWATRSWLEDFIYRIEVSALYFLLAGVIALLIALLTVSVQTIRAAKANPAESLRND